MKYVLRDVQEGDLPWLYELTKESYQDLVTRQFGEWDDNLQKKSFLAKWQAGRKHMIVNGTTRLGAVLVVEFPDYHYLRSIQIKREYQGRGLATDIIRRLVSNVREKGYPLRLRVLHGNSRAKQLYERLGFCVIEELEHHHLMEIR